MTKKQEYPKVVVDSSGRSKISEIRYLVNLVKQLDGGSKKDIAIIEYYDKQLQKLSDGSIGVRFWIDWDDTLRCTVVYPDSAVKEFIEYNL